MRKYPQLLLNIPVRSKPAFEEVARIKESVKQAEQELNGSGRVLLRYSGTEELARVMVECEDAKQCKRVAESLAQVGREELGK